MRLKTSIAARTVGTAIVVLLPVAALSSPAAAATPVIATDQRAQIHLSRPAGAASWQRYHAQSFTAAAGTLCRFTLHSEVVFDREYVRTAATFPDGSARTQQFVGPLVVRVTNRDTGRSVRRDLSARGTVQYHRDGSFEFHLQGPAAIGFHPGDHHRPGYFVLRGLHTVHFAADGTRTVTVDQGRQENLCATLT